MKHREKPKLTIVATSRNDNHGGGLLKRMQIFVDGVLFQSNKYELYTELILVEWNPPENELRLAQALQWPDNHSFCDIRIIQVPHQLHNRYRFPEKLPLHQMIGKNVGIYRAHGDFILSTNIDIIFTDELFQFLGSDGLRKDVIYRADRFDVDSAISLEATHDEKLIFCENHIIRNFSYYNEHRIMAKDMNEYGIKIEHPHTNACGDFQLMAREHWHELRGYPEFDIYPLHVDSLFQFNAVLHGINEVCLIDKLRVYHIDHEGSWVPGSGERIQTKFKQSNIPIMSQIDPYIFVNPIVSDLDNSNIFNNDQWGLQEYSLDEYVKLSETGFSYNIVSKDQSISPLLASDTDYWLNQRDKLNTTMLTFGMKTFSDWINNFITGHDTGTVKKNYEDKKIVVFGAGSCYEIFIKPALDFFKVQPAFIVDNQKCNTSMDGIDIKSVTELSEEKKDDLLIIVASSYYKEIKEQLGYYQFLENVHFIRGYYMPLFWNKRSMEPKGDF